MVDSVVDWRRADNSQKKCFLVEARWWLDDLIDRLLQVCIMCARQHKRRAAATSTSHKVMVERIEAVASIARVA